MKNYKDHEKQYLGSSDIATVKTIALEKGELKLYPIHFGSDGSYYAYIVDSDTEIPSHYHLVHDIKCTWIEFYDDNEKTVSWINNELLKNAKAPVNVKIYRAANMGCIIQVIGA